MKLLIATLVLLLAVLQYQLWMGERGLRDVWRLHETVQAQEQDNQRLKERNQALAAEVKDLKQGLEAVEERARSELGMIKKGETFYQVVEEE